MEASVTIRDVMDRTYPAVSEGDPVGGAADLMYRDGVEAVVVHRGQEVVGVLRALDAVALVAEGLDPEETTVGEAMVGPVPSIDAAAPPSEAASRLVEEGARWAVVVDDGDVVGVLSAHDVLAARAAFPEGPEFEGEPGSPGVAAGLEDQGGGALPGEDATDQGICEGCGSLSRPLRPHNGQLLCPDCYGV